MTISAIEEPSRIDIIVIIGDSFNRVAEIENDDGTPADLSGFNGVAEIIDPDTREVLATFTIPALVDDGNVPLILKVEDTKDLDVGTAEWSLTLIGKSNPDISTSTIMVGDASIRKRKGAS